MKKIRNNQLILALLNLVLFLIGIGFFRGLDLTPFSLNVHPAVDFFVLTISFFILSILFAGFLTPVIFFYYGLISSSFLSTNPLGIILSVVPLLVASYAGSITGHFALQDLKEKQNLFEHKKEILILFFASLLLAIIAGFLFEYLAGVDQSGIFPFLSESS